MELSTGWLTTGIVRRKILVRFRKGTRPWRKINDPWIQISVKIWPPPPYSHSEFRYVCNPLLILKQRVGGVCNGTGLLAGVELLGALWPDVWSLARLPLDLHLGSLTHLWNIAHSSTGLNQYCCTLGVRFSAGVLAGNVLLGPQSLLGHCRERTYLWLSGMHSLLSYSD